MTTPTRPAPGRLVRGPSAAQALGLCHATLRRLVKRGVLPPPVRLNKRLHLYDLDALAKAMRRLREGGAA